MENNFNSNPNQRKISLHKEKADNKAKENNYAKINLIALQNAMSKLKPSTFQLWLYFAKNQDKFTFYLSKVDFLNWSNIKDSSYYNAFNDLVKQKYLIPRDTGSEQITHYDFYEKPQEEKNIVITTQKTPKEIYPF